MRLIEIFCDKTDTKTVAKTVVVVGSAPNLKQFGSEIDSFDVVVRFNLAYPTDPKLLGNKTTVVVCNNHVSTAMKRKKFGLYVGRKIITQDHAKALAEHLQQTNPYKIYRTDGGAPNPKNKEFKIGHGSSTKYCNAVLQSLGIQQRLAKLPRMGFHLVCLLIKHNVKPHLFYFDIDTPSMKKYYYKTLNKSVWHEVNKECAILKILRSKDLVVVH